MPLQTQSNIALFTSSCPPLQARDVGLEIAPIMTFVGNRVQIASPVEDVCHPREQNRDETGDRSKEERRCNDMRDDLGKVVN